MHLFISFLVLGESVCSGIEVEIENNNNNHNHHGKLCHTFIKYH